MPLSLEKYAEFLDNRNDPQPLGPAVSPCKAKPHLPALTDIAAVIFSGYGTLLLIAGGQLHFLNPDLAMQKISLDKTIQEFKMWQSMSRKPGEPSKYMAQIFQQVLDGMIAAAAGAKHVEFRADKVWEGILARLTQKDYFYDAAFYGPVDEYAQKITYYYFRASQGVATYAGEQATLVELKRRGVLAGIHADGQCNTPVQLWRLLNEQSKTLALTELFEPTLCLWSFVTGFKTEAPASFSLLAKALAAKEIEPATTLYVGSSVERDIAPAKARGYRTALLLADKSSTDARPEQLKDSRTRPDVLLTSFDQLVQVVGTR